MFGGKIMSTIKVGRILVVEDEELLAATIAEALHDAYEVICAFNVHDAVDHLSPSSTWSSSIAFCRAAQCGRSCWKPIARMFRWC